MNAGNVIFLLLIVGGVFAMFFRHRGGHAHGGMGGCGRHGHNHGGSSTGERREEDKKPLLGEPGPHGHDHDHEPAAAGGCHGVSRAPSREGDIERERRVRLGYAPRSLREAR